MSAIKERAINRLVRPTYIYVMRLATLAKRRPMSYVLGMSVESFRVPFLNEEVINIHMPQSQIKFYSQSQKFRSPAGRNAIRQAGGSEIGQCRTVTAGLGAVHKVRHARRGEGIREGVTVCDRGRVLEHVTSHF